MTLNISTWEDFETKLQGETITMQISKLSRDAMISIMPCLKQAGAKQADLESAENKATIYYELAETSLEMQKIAASVLPGHVRDIKGLNIDGEPATPEAICSAAWAVNLVVMILNKLVSISQLSETDVKNSSRPSGGKAETA